MIEAEIVELVALTKATLLSVLQWWASVTFAVVALAHFGKQHLRLHVVIVVILLYTSFSFVMWTIYSDHASTLTALVADLSNLASSQADGSAVIEYLASTGPSSNGIDPFVIALLLALFGTFIAAVVFVVISYVANRRSEAMLRSD